MSEIDYITEAEKNAQEEHERILNYIIDEYGKALEKLRNRAEKVNFVPSSFILDVIKETDEL